MKVDYATLIEGHKKFIENALIKKKLRIPLLMLSKKMRCIKRMYLSRKADENIEKEFICLAEISDDIDRNMIYRFLHKVLCRIRDIDFEIKNGNNNWKIKKEIRQVGYKYLTIVCIIKNEARYIKEWIVYYKLMNVDHIYLFNNGSTDNIQEVLEEEIASGYVTLIDYKGANAQLPAYRLAAKCLKNQCRWLAYIDADEYLLPREGTLKEFLLQQEIYPALGINWTVYGPGGHKTRPDGLVTENYWYTFEDADNLLNLRIKSIVNPKEIYNITSPHFCTLKGGKYAVDEDGEEITTRWMYISGSGSAFTGRNHAKKIRINHYWTKSEQELAEKCNRGYAAGGFSPNYENIMKRLDYPQKVDKAIEPYISQIKKAMQQ